MPDVPVSAANKGASALLVDCQLDSFQRSSSAQVVSCDVQANGTYALQLSQNFLYPEGGGQPPDQGCLLQPTSSGDEQVAVVDVQKAGNKVLHFVTAEVPAGSAVRVEVDWHRRFDHMQMHTGQHLLSAVVDEVTGADTTGWEMHPFTDSKDSFANTARIDLSIQALSREQEQEIEARCNDLIRAAHRVTPHLLTQESAAAADGQRLLQSKQLRGAVPSWDKVGGQLRLLEIEGIDVNACGGTHLQTTAQIQLIKLVGQSRSHGGTSLTFLAGNRALLAFGMSLQREARLNKVLGCGGSDHEATIARLQAERKQMHKDRKALLEEAARGAALALVSTLPQQGGVGWHHRDGGDAAFLTCMAGAILAERPKALVLLTASATPCTSKKDTPGPFMLLGPPELVAEAGPQVAAILQAKGGGRGSQYQGKAQCIGTAEQAERILQDVWNRH